MKNKVTITVSGTFGTGKSCICRVIQKALEKHGISTTVDYVVESDREFVQDKKNVKRVLNCVKDKKGFHVVIKEDFLNKTIIDKNSILDKYRTDKE